jgi:hypothetical protein
VHEAESNVVFGLKISREVNVLALIAFILSTSSLALQGWQYWRGAQVTMTVGERVNLVRRTNPARPEVPFLVVNARLNYLNSGAVGRDALIGDERLQVRLGDDSFEYRWLHFELIVPDRQGLPEAKVLDGAHTFIAPGAGAASHQTTFVAFPGAPVRDGGDRPPFAEAIPWGTFMLRLELGLDAPLRLRFSAVGLDGSHFVHECAVLMTDEVALSLRENGWATALCLG